MPELVHLLEELFNLHGHRVTREAALEGRTGTVYTVPLLAEGHTSILVTGHFDGTTLAAADVHDFLATLEDTGADLGVICHAGAATSEAVQMSKGRILLWGRDQMIRLIGEMQVAQCLGETPPMLPLGLTSISTATIAESVSDLMPAAFRVPEPISNEELLAIQIPEAMPEPQPEPIPDLSLLQMPEAFATSRPQSTLVEAPFTLDIAPMEEDPFKPFPQLANPLPLPNPAQMPIELPQMPGVQSLTPPAAYPVAPVASLVPTTLVPQNPYGNSPLAARVHSLAPLVAAAASLSVPTATYAPLTGSPVRSQASAPQVMQTRAAPALLTHEIQMPAGAKAETARHQSRPLLPVRITPDEARRRVKDKLFSVSHVELILHPVHLFDYECDVLKEGSLAFDTLDGRLQVHGSDKSSLDVDPDQANPEAPTLLPPNHAYATTERVLRIPADRALQLATAHVMTKHTRNVDVRIPDHNNSLFYTEKRKVQPTPDQVRVTPLGIYFRPAWRMHGGNGQLDLDAVDGRELFAELRNSRSDTMIVD